MTVIHKTTAQRSYSSVLFRFPGFSPNRVTWFTTYSHVQFLSHPFMYNFITFSLFLKTIYFLSLLVSKLTKRLYVYYLWESIFHLIVYF